ncbi:hypothetical protein SOVF_113010 [Spinacia oleracea]|nr:hypothetical protein SOVF_113010 [Spinacia oleracea]
MMKSVIITIDEIANDNVKVVQRDKVQKQNEGQVT